MDIMSYLMGQNSAIKKGMKVEVVTELPEVGQPNVIYLVPKQTAGQDDVFDEYIWVNNDWELIGSTAIDISGKQDVMQFSTMPTADSTTVGKIIQYVGATTNDYTNGYFYIGTTDGTNYGWDQIDVQPGVEASNIAVCTIIGKNIGAIQVQPQNNGVVNLSGGAQTELTTFLNNHLGKYIILQLIGNNDANCIIYLGYLQTTTGNNIQTFPKYIFFYGSGSYNGSVFYGTTKVMYSYNATTNTYSIGFYENPLDGKPQPIATQKYVDDNKGQTIQYSTMPTASANTVGQIVQYTGTTDSTYTNGYFYIGTSTTTTVDNEEVTTYGWDNINVQDASSGNSDDIITFIDTNASDESSFVNSMNNNADNITNLEKLGVALRSGKTPVVLFAKKWFDYSGSPENQYLYKVPMFYSASLNTNTNTYSFTFYTLYPFSSGSYKYKYDVQFRPMRCVWYNANEQGFTSRSFRDNYILSASAEAKQYPISHNYIDTMFNIPEYSRSSTYQIGDYVGVYDINANTSANMYKIYKCNTADTTGTWDASKWDEKTYMEYLSDTLVGGALNGSY